MVAAYVPWAHVVHTVAITAEYCPAEQFTHTVEVATPVAVEKAPAAHLTQLVAPVELS